MALANWKAQQVGRVITALEKEDLQTLESLVSFVAQAKLEFEAKNLKLEACQAFTAIMPEEADSDFLRELREEFMLDLQSFEQKLLDEVSGKT